jgi:hypothetical protein
MKSTLYITINVTEEDIQGGCYFDSENCPVARAGTRALRELGVQGSFSANPSSVRRMASFTIWHNGCQTHIGSVPPSANNWMLDYDRFGEKSKWNKEHKSSAKVMWPFSFDAVLTKT